MARKAKMDRRSMLKTSGAAVGAGLAAMSSSARGAEKPAAGKPPIGPKTCKKHPLPKWKNSDFYDKDGKFLVDKAKDACIALMAYHRYPVFKGMKKNLWVFDYNTGQYLKLGLAARMWVNNEKERYMQMDLFLMPGQMLPEHYHLKTAKNPAKMEGWLIRHGLSHVVGEGEPNLPKEVVIPKCHMNGTASVLHDVICGPGDFTPLNRVTARHWQYAGPKGAIITEVATVHDDSGVRHSDKALNDAFLNQ